MNVQKRILYPLTALIAVNTQMALLTRKVVFPSLIVLFPVSLIVIWRILYLIWGPPGSSPQESDPYVTYSILCVSMFLQFIVPMLGLLKGMSTFTEEIEEGTLMFLRLRPVPRSVIILGKYLSFVVSTGILLTFSLWTCYILLSSIPGSDMFWGDFTTLVKDTWVLCLGVASYGAVMMLIGTYFKRSLMYGIFLIFVWDAFAAYIPGSAHKLTIKHYLQSIFPHEKTETGIAAMLSDNVPSSMSVSLTTLGLTIATCVVLTTLAFQLKQLDSPPEAE